MRSKVTVGVASHTCLSKENSAKETRKLLVEIDGKEVEMAEVREFMSVHLQRYRG